MWVLHSSCEYSDHLAGSEQSGRLNSADLLDAFMSQWPLRVYVMGAKMQDRMNSILSFCVPVRISISPISTDQKTYRLVVNLMVNMYETPVHIRQCLNLIL